MTGCLMTGTGGLITFAALALVLVVATPDTGGWRRMTMLGGALTMAGCVAAGEAIIAVVEFVFAAALSCKSSVISDWAPTISASVLPVTNEVRTINRFAGVIPDAILLFLTITVSRPFSA
jgi:hypothetical protein